MISYIASQPSKIFKKSENILTLEHNTCSMLHKIIKQKKIKMICQIIPMTKAIKLGTKSIKYRETETELNIEIKENIIISEADPTKCDICVHLLIMCLKSFI